MSSTARSRAVLGFPVIDVLLAGLVTALSVGGLVDGDVDETPLALTVPVAVVIGLSLLGRTRSPFATPKSRRPWVRAYTLRKARPDVGEVDIDFVIHGDEKGSIGPAARFALDARPGDRVGFLDQGVGFTPDHPHDWTLLIGDETALPAIAGICRSLPETARGVAIIEIPTAEDQQELAAPAGMHVTWIPRDGSPHQHGRSGELALRALTAATLPDGAVHAHAIGESALATGARRHLVQERGVSKRHVDFVGYWRHGRPATS